MWKKNNESCMEDFMKERQNIYKIKIIEKDYTIGLVDVSDSKLITAINKDNLKIDYFEIKDYLNRLNFSKEIVFEYEIDSISKNTKTLKDIEIIKNQMNEFAKRTTEVGKMINDGSLTKLINEFKASLSNEKSYEDGRTCEICGEDISDRPSHHYLCYDCWCLNRYGTPFDEYDHDDEDYEDNNYNHEDDYDERDGYDDKWGYYNIHGEFPDWDDED